MAQSLQKDEEFSYTCFIRSKLTALTECTTFGAGFVTRLFESRLINGEEKHFFMDERSANVIKATKLYTETTSRWIDSQFKEFKTILVETDNHKAFQIFSDTPDNPLAVEVSEEAQKEVGLQKQQEGHNDMKTPIEVTTQEIVNFLLEDDILAEDLKSKEGKLIGELGIQLHKVSPSIDKCTLGISTIEQLLSQVISLWCNANGRAATVGKLCEAVKNIDRTTLAEDLEDVYGKEARVRDKLSCKRK